MRNVCKGKRLGAGLPCRNYLRVAVNFLTDRSGKHRVTFLQRRSSRKVTSPHFVTDIPMY